MINQNHLLVAFLATLLAAVALVVFANGQVGGDLGLTDALTGLLLIEGGAIAGAQVPKG